MIQDRVVRESAVSGRTADRRLTSCTRVGGSGEIRTHGGVAPSPGFKTGALNRSATLPHSSRPGRSTLSYISCSSPVYAPSRRATARTDRPAGAHCDYFVVAKQGLGGNLNRRYRSL